MKAAAPLLAALLATSCATFSPPPAARDCGPPRFPYQEGWLGGDAAYSVMLGRDRVLWLFGDSFVGAPAATDRVDSAFIHNSVAVASCGRDQRWQFDYTWGERADGTPRAFLAPEAGDRYWWLFDGFLHKGALYLALLVVEPVPPRGAFQLPFRFAGVQLARIANPSDPAEDWRPEILPLSDGSEAMPASAIHVGDDHVYLFTFLQREPTRSPRGLARLPLAALDGDATALPGLLEYLARDGAWKPGLVAEDARILMDDDATEMSVHFDPTAGRWLAIYSRTVPDPKTSAPSDVVHLRSAEALEGPWSESTPLYRIPELDARYPEGDPNTFCYAAKAHPSLARSGRLLFTYVCNLYTPLGGDSWAILGRLAQQMRLYRPYAVSVPFPALPTPPR